MEDRRGREIEKEMGESSSAESKQLFFQKQWEEFKEFWAERYPYREIYTRMMKRDKSLPRWSSSDVEEFIASDPVHGPVLKTLSEAKKFAEAGSVIGAVSTASFVWKYSRSLHGGGLSFAAGAVFGWTFGMEIANHWLQLYRLDPVAPNIKFLEWWERKIEEQS